MKPTICIVGATGVLGEKILKYSNKYKIRISCITFFNNHKKANSLKDRYRIKNCFSLKDKFHIENFKHYLNNNIIDIIYFLDCGSESLVFVNLFLKKNKKSYIAIANKELIISGGSLLFNKINKSKNYFIPLDSEHFSLSNNLFLNQDNNINKIYITASGGPFYFNKNINLNSVTLKQVLKHPKWKMGINNSIDSSNFINKLLEMYELSFIYNIDLNKISFLVSKDAYIHSIIEYKDGTISINCFDNDMMIPLLKPMSFFYDIEFNYNYNKIFNLDNFKLEPFSDKRFYISKNLNKLKKLSHQNIIKFMILNNYAHTKYLTEKINYNKILPFIINNLNFNEEYKSFKNFDDILSFVKNEKFSVQSL